ncbi:hypothetical protein EV426DRAFT_712602 [Tirmania nivea]|nr:hypothetical protein EV426DRAFT_712602 [Tirmania nivea]
MPLRIKKQTPEPEQHQLPTPTTTPARYKEAHEVFRIAILERRMEMELDKRCVLDRGQGRGREPGWLDSEDEAVLEAQLER